MLRVTLGPRSLDDPLGRYRIECRTCTYQSPIKDDSPLFERKIMKNKKEVDDVLGGNAAWENVDRTSGTIVKPVLVRCC